MSETHRIQVLESRLRDLRCRAAAAWERSIVEAACAAIEAEILRLSRSCQADHYWRVKAPAPSLAAAVRAAC